MNTTARICLMATFAALMMGAMHLHAETFSCPNDSGQFPDASNCRNYFLCWGWNSTAQVCPHNMLFDVNQGICLLSEEVNCASRLNPDKDETFVCPAEPLYGLFPAGDEQAYYYCANGIASIMYCPCGTVFDTEQNAQCVPTGE